LRRLRERRPDLRNCRDEPAERRHEGLHDFDVRAESLEPRPLAFLPLELDDAPLLGFSGLAGDLLFASSSARSLRLSLELLAVELLLRGRDLPAVRLDAVPLRPLFRLHAFSLRAGPALGFLPGRVLALEFDPLGLFEGAPLVLDALAGEGLGFLGAALLLLELGTFRRDAGFLCFPGDAGGFVGLAALFGECRFLGLD
jgi:hypothetical protein